jgi:4-hydroxy-tetrahydrodipicolinate synthase
VPVVAYTIPSATHVALPVGVAGALAAEGRILSIKDSTGDLAGLRALLAAVDGTGVTVLTGSEVIADVSVQVGAAGIVPGLGNVDPEGYVRLFAAASRGDAATAATEQARLVRLFAITQVADRTRIGVTAGALGAFKAALRLRGVIACERTAPPLGALDDAERDRIRELLSEAGLTLSE